MTARPDARFVIVALVAVGVALTLRVFYPGVMTFDALYVHMDAMQGRYGDWQSPVMVAIWRLIDPLAPGSASMFFLIIAALLDGVCHPRLPAGAVAAVGRDPGAAPRRCRRPPS